MHEGELFSALESLRETSTPLDPLVDEIALLLAQRIRRALSGEMKIALTFEQWTRLTAIIQVEVANALRLATFGTLNPANGDEAVT